jgi:hypothetical protein
LSYAPAASQIEDQRYRHWLGEMHESHAYHRKVWEWCFILEALHSAGALRPGAKALGFGVGHEPIPAVLAKSGLSVVATDQPSHEEAEPWDRTNEHAPDIHALRNDDICDEQQFRDLVTFREVDMRALPTDLVGFDALWSSCCIEHLGSPQAGLDFVLESIGCLRPGGIGIHTTEFDTLDNDPIVEVGPPYTTFYRRRDLEALALRLRRDGHSVTCNFHVSSRTPADRYVDKPPYTHDPHLRLQVDRAVATSFGIVVRKAQ